MSRRLLLHLLGLAVVGAGCASIPAESGVREVVVDEAGSVEQGAGVRVFANEPQPGAGPGSIVLGFLDASGAVDFGVAGQYLALESGRPWNPRKVIIYSGQTVTAEREEDDESQVRLTATNVAELDDRGAYVSAAANSGLDVVFDLQRMEVNGSPEWRITTPAPEDLPLYLPEGSFQREYDPFNLHFPTLGDTAERMLVPDPIFLRSSRPPNELADALVDAVLAGPTTWLESAVRPAQLPAGITKAPVQIEAGVATVELVTDSGGADDLDIRTLAGELFWTLEQLPDVEQIAIVVDGRELVEPGGEPTYAAVRPARSSQSPAPLARPAYLLIGGALHRLPEQADGETNPAPVAGPFGSSGDRRLSDFAVQPTANTANPSTDLIAGITEDGTELYLAQGPDYQQEGPALTGHLSSPTWDRRGRLWVLDQTAAGTVVRVKVRDGDFQIVATPDLPGRPKRIAVSEDGTRMVWITDENHAELLLVRELSSGFQLAPTARQLAPRLDTVTDVAWQDAGTLVVLGTEPASVVQPYEIPIDGSGLERQFVVESMPVSVAAAPGRPALAQTDDNRILQRSSDELWLPVLDEAAVHPHYAG